MTVPDRVLVLTPVKDAARHLATGEAGLRSLTYPPALPGVGGTMFLVRADAHREGLIFPPFLYGRRSPLIRPDNEQASWRTPWARLRRGHRGEIGTEGLGIMAHDMRYQCWGLPHLEIRHHDG